MSVADRYVTGAGAAGLCRATALLVAVLSVGAAGPAGAQPTLPPQVQHAGVTSNPLVTTSYSLVQESDGNRPKSGSQVFLLFGPNGQAFVYASDSTEAVADAGSYSYADGELSLRIATGGLHIDATFALDARATGTATAPRASMPFQIFSSSPGSSLWQPVPMGLDQGILAIYNAESNSGLRTTNTEAAAQAYAYAQAWVDQQSSSGSKGAPAFGAAKSPCGSYCVTSVTDLGNDVQINYEHAQSVVVSLYTAGPPCSLAACARLTTSELAKGPGAITGPTLHPDKEFDPRSKTAVLIAPIAGMVGPTALSDMTTILRQRGYAVRLLTNGGASIASIASSLKSGPGFVLFSTYGNEAGQLMTGQSVPIQGFVTASQATSAYAEAGSALGGEGLGGLAHYEVSGVPAYYVTEPNCSLRVTFSPSAACDWRVAVTPAFWEWLRTKRGANFSHSFVFVNASETDVVPALRNQVRARAYFAFSADVAPNFATDIALYCIESLDHPTRSVEEVFYNLLRLGKTHQMIYKEDAVLNGSMGAPRSDASVDILDGWGWDGTTMIGYRGNGWLSGEVTAEQVWWMLSAARLNSSAIAGAAGLDNCYTRYWSHGSLGGPESAFCNTASGGTLNSAGRVRADLAYAKYLLDGAPPRGFPATRVPPRWTLDD